MLESLMVSLVATGIRRGVDTSADELRDRLRRRELSTDIDALSTEFYKQLREAVAEDPAVAAATGEADVADRWDAIATELDELDDVYFADEETAVAEITGAIERSLGIDPATNPDADRRLQGAVADAYGDAMDGFYERVAGTELASQLGLRSAADLRDRVRTVQASLDDLADRLEGRQYYSLFEGSREGHDRAARFLTEGRPELPHVDREDVPADPPGERTLLLGKRGAGKTRTLAEWVRAAEDVDRVVVPREALTRVEDLDPLLGEDLAGHVALVWDDVDAVDPTTENRVVRDAVLKLADHLADEGRLTVLLAARADRRDRLPGDLDDPTGLWEDFEVLELGELSDLAFGDVLGAVYDHYGIEEEGTSPTTEIGRRMGAQTPLGVLSATRAVVDDIEDPEPGGAQDWAYAYERLEDSPRRQSVLEAVQILHDLRITPTVRLVEGLFTEVFGHDGLRDRFEPHIEALERDGWFERVEAPTPGAGPHGYELVPATDGEELLVAPSVAYEAVPSRTDDAVDELATFLEGAVEEYVAADATAVLSVDRRWRWRLELRLPVAIHLRFIEYLADGPPRKRADPGIDRLQGDGVQPAPNEERIETYLRAWGDCSPPSGLLDDAFGTMLDRTDRPAALRALYARYLMAAGRSEDAATQLEMAIEEDAPPVAEGYAGVLALARGDDGAAVQHLAAVHEAWDPEETDWHLDPDVIPEYARLLAALGEWTAARDTFDYIDLDGGLTDLLTAEDFVTWGRALRETGDPEAAVAKFETALERSNDCVPALVELGRHAADQGEHDRAIERFEHALEHDPEDTTALTGLIEAYTGSGRLTRARETVEAAIDRHPEEGAFRLHLVDVERHAGDAEAAAAAYEAAIERFEESETVRSVRREYLALLLDGLPAEAVGEDIPDAAVHPYPAERFQRALEQVRPLYDHDRAALTDATDPEEAAVERFARTAVQRVVVEGQATGPGAARERVGDALLALPRDRPERGDLVWAYVDQLVDDTAAVWGRQSCAYRLLIAREYEAAARLLAPLWEAREEFDAENRFWPNLRNCLALYAGCVAGGFAPGDGLQVAEWVRGTGLSGTPAALVGEYLLDGTVADSPGALYYGADVSPGEVDPVPTPQALEDQSLTDLEMLAAAAVVGELAGQGGTSPFDDATAAALDRRPGPDENPWLGTVEGIGPKLEFRLRQAGVQTVADLRRLDAEALQAVEGVGASTAETVLEGLATQEE